MVDDRGQNRVGTVEWGNVVDSGCILRVEPTGFSDRLGIGTREIEVGDDAMIFTLSNQKDGSAINQVRDSQVSAQEDRNLKF